MKLKTKVLDKIETLYYLQVYINWCKQNFEEEQNMEVMIAYIADAIKFELSDFSINSLIKLNTEISFSKIIDSEILNKPIVELTESGIVSLEKSFVRYSYDDVHLDCHHTTVLKINGVEYQSKFMSSKQVEEFKEKLLILFDKEEFEYTDPLKKVEAIYEIFKSPRMASYTSGYNAMVDAVRDMNSYNEALKNGTLQEYKRISYNKIIQLYLDYLWDCESQKKNLKYVYSFESWVNKNSHMWGEEICSPKESLNLFLEEHKQIIKIFNQINEPEIIWQRKKEKLSSNVLLLEIMRNGLDGL